MSDFSMFSLFTAGLACLIPFTSAYTKPVGAEPKGNPIYTPGLHDVVPAGEPYTISWDPTTDGTVTLVLLKGPSENAIPQYSIIENYPNTGYYVWTPEDDLEPSSGEGGYGIQLIVDATGQYQYTTQFSVSNDHYKPGSYGSSSSSSAAAGYSSAASSASSAWSMVASSGYAAPTGIWSHSMPNGTHPRPTGYMSHNTTMKPMPTHHIRPTLYTSMSAPASSASSYAPIPSSVTPSRPSATNAGSSLTASFVGLVFAAGVAVFAL
ncbi:uncharacterized protein LTR77_008675 [Saxophila tyrrhenica]|uniref:Yeast cell wall synthesis Kre9/Knh1-like N-terminal domain-containing protein n=1 Tax=Saxophila tyrrhenica TaxID=1690608 RepID=A0AAV9P000_9PEZI|nr:hypothetical protein LTR77_008675 [Saxophila tyrrhenica]